MSKQEQRQVSKPRREPLKTMSENSAAETEKKLIRAMDLVAEILYSRLSERFPKDIAARDSLECPKGCREMWADGVGYAAAKRKHLEKQRFEEEKAEMEKDAGKLSDEDLDKAGLTDSEKEVLLLCTRDRLSYKEIGERRGGTSPNTVHAQLISARKKLYRKSSPTSPSNGNPSPLTTA